MSVFVPCNNFAEPPANCSGTGNDRLGLIPFSFFFYITLQQLLIGCFYVNYTSKLCPKKVEKDQLNPYQPYSLLEFIYSKKLKKNKHDRGSCFNYFNSRRSCHNAICCTSFHR
ncbi:uncharacterized protein LOC129988499 [Argiope bruennichi]|uniref:uncharacterized protein LOC129988499 n=1 Tax=Argiope bruennichi TaxID=94029 RepID=UPI0024954923|nr:uncharacterized protein LOC129988499 [Argiope bruennichi]